METGTLGGCRSPAVETSVSRDAVRRHRNPRRGHDAILPHAEAGYLVARDPIMFGFGRAGGARNQIDSGAQQRRVAGAVIAPRPGPVAGAAIAIQTQETVARYHLMRTQQTQAAIAGAVDQITGDQHVRRLVIRIGVVENDAVLRVRVLVGRLAADARIVAYLAIVEAVQIHAFPVDVFKMVAGVDGSVHVTPGVDGHRHRPVDGVHQIGRIPDAPAAVAAHGNVGGVSHLDGVARHFFDEVLLDGPVGVAGRTIVGVRPDGVAAHAADDALPHLEIARAFFQQDSPGCIVAAGWRERSAVVDADVVYAHARRSAHQHRVVGHLAERDATNEKARGIFDYDAAVAVIAGEEDVGRRQRDGLLQGGPMADDAKAGET